MSYYWVKKGHLKFFWVKKLSYHFWPIPYHLSKTTLYEAFFEITQGKAVQNLAVFENGKHLTYPGWSSKDSDGKNFVTIVSGLEYSIFVTFECLVDNCKKDNGLNDEGELKHQYLLEPCAFNKDGTHIKNLKPRSEDDESVKPFLCVSGENFNDRDTNKLMKGDFSVKINQAVLDSESKYSFGDELTSYMVIFLECRFLGKKPRFWVKKRQNRHFVSFSAIFVTFLQNHPVQSYA